jgi:hypothetical protein
VVKPVGVVMTRLVTPLETGWKTTAAVSEPALMVTGLVTIVPTVVTELVTVTLTLEPVRMFWNDWAVRVVGLNWAAKTVRLVFAEPAVVEKLADSQMMPEGVSVTVLAPLLYPGAEAVI